MIASAIKGDYPYKDHNFKNANSFVKPTDFPIFFWTFDSEFDKIIYNEDAPQGRGTYPQVMLFSITVLHFSYSRVRQSIRKPKSNINPYLNP